MILARNFTRLLGFKEVDVGQHEAQRLLKGGAPVAYLTLTNDHQPRTEGAQFCAILRNSAQFCAILRTAQF